MSNILKQTLAGMRQQPLITTLTIVGTALAICLIMIVMMTREVQIADYGAEPNRFRTLHVSSYHLKNRTGGNTYKSSLPADVVNGIFMKMKTVEAVALYSPYMSTLDCNMAGGENVPLGIKVVNNGFFKVFSLDFVEGRPFTEEECASDLPVAIISKAACRKMFGQERGVIGKHFYIANHDYRLVGVVEDVSKMLKYASADVWVAGSVTHKDHPLAACVWLEQSVAMLAKSPADFPKIRQETNRLLAAYNKSIVPDTLDFVGAPDEQEVASHREWSNVVPDMESIYLRYLFIFVILLIVPAINIASMTQSRLRQRTAEIGVRRAFGAKRSTILLQTLAESFIQTLAAGLLGLVLCFVFCYFLADYIFDTGFFYRTTELTFDLGILFSPSIYGWTLLFCLVLNVMSTIIPAWRASRCNIVEALK